MKFLHLSLAAILICMGCCAQASAYDEVPYEENCCSNANSFYAEIYSGANFLETERRGDVRTRFDTGYIVSGSIGYRWCYGFRLEAEYAYRRNCIHNVHFLGRTFNLGGHFQSSSYMANLLWDLPLCNWGCDFWGIYPFVGGGIGYDVQQIHAKRNGLSFRGNKKDFAWQVIAGLGYPIFCNTDISIEYKFHKGGFKHVYNHSIGVGLTYNFAM